MALSLGSPPAGVTRRHDVVEPGLSSTPLRRPRPPGRLVRAELLEEGGAPMWAAFMGELRSLHLGAPPPEVSVFGQLQAAYEAVVARRAPA